MLTCKNRVLSLIALAFVLIFCPASAWAAIAVDSTTTGTTTTATATVSHVTAGANRLMLVGVSTGSTIPNVTSITYNGVALTFVGKVSDAGVAQSELWKLVAPPTGTFNVVVTFASSASLGAVVGVTTFTGVDQTTPLGAYTSANGKSAAASVAVVSAAGELVFDNLGVEQGGVPSITGGQTQQWALYTSGNTSGGGSTKAGAASVTMSWSFASGNSWGQGAVSIKPVSGPTTTLATGTDPGNSSLAPGGAATMADAFSFQTSSGTDTITAATVTLATGTSGGLSLVEITDDTGSTVYGSVSNPASDTPAITFTTSITATTTLNQYKIRVTPKTHANMPAPAGSSYAVTALISAFTGTNTQAGSDTAGTTVTIDNLSPGNVTAATATPASTQVALAWTNPVDADLNSIIVLRRTVSVVTDTPVEGATYTIGNTIGSSTVACVVASPTATCTDTSLTNGTAYYYKIFTKDSNGNYSATGVVPTGSPATPNVTTILANGTDPGNASLAPGGVATMADAFTLQTSNGTDTITAATVTLATGTSGGLSLVEITNAAGTTVYGSAANPANDTPAITLSTNTLTATTTVTQYKIRVTPKSHANMPAPAGSSYAVTARISTFTGTNAQAGSDTAGTTVTIDNLSPGNVTAAIATAGNAQISLAWTNPADADLNSIIVLRRTTSVVADAPVEGSTYTVGNTIGSSTVACVVASPTATCTDTGLTNGTAYFYKIFAKDSNGNYSATGVVPTGSPATPASGPSTTLGNGTDPGNTSLSPSGAATNVDGFSFQTSSGTDTITNVTVTLATGTSVGLNKIEIISTSGSTVYGSVTNPASDTPTITLSTNTLSATTTLTEYRIRITPKSDANMPAPPGASYPVTAYISSWTGSNGPAGSDTGGTTVTIDNLSPGNVTAATATPGNDQVSLAWTNPVDSDLNRIIVLRRTTSLVTDTPVEGSTYTVGNTIGSSTVACWVSSPGTSCTDTAPVNGTTYYYKIFAQDTSGNYSATGVVPAGSPVTPALTTIANGTDPGAVTLAPGDAATMADAFTFQTSNGTDAISAVTVTLATGTYASLSLVEITDSAGTTVYGSISNPASDTPAITLTTNITATTTLTTYKIRVTPKSHANMPAPPGASYAVTARISAWTNTVGQGGSDTAGTTVTIDNLSPGNVTAATATAGVAQVSLAWTNPFDADLNSIIVLRRTVSVVTDTPVEGTTYVVGNTIGSSTVACVVASPTATCTDTGLTVGTAYYYKIFAKDSNGNYSATGVVPTGSPATPVQGITLATGTDPSNSTLAPGGAATMADAFTLQTTSGTDTVTAVTVTLGTGTSTGLSLVEITNDAGTTVYGSVSNPVSDTPAITLTTNITATITATQYKIRVTPKTHANMAAPAGASYPVTAYISSWTSSLLHAGSDSGTATVTIDNLSPGNVTAATTSIDNAQVPLAWTNPADADLHSIIVLRRTTSSVTDVPVEGTTYTVGNTIGSSTVACVVASPTTTCTDIGLTNGTAYYYKIFAKDSSGNYAATGVVPSGSPVTPSSTTLGNGTDPTNATLAPGGAATNADAFSFQTSNGTDAINDVTVTLATGTYIGISTVEITSSSGGTVYGSVSNPASDTPVITLSSFTLSATTTLTEYRIRITPKSHANMAAPPGASYSVTAYISNWTATKAHVGSDTGGTTVTIDNLSPGDVTASNAAAGNTQVVLTWINPADADLNSIIVFRRTSSVVTDTPSEGSTYSAGNLIGSSTVACVVVAPTATCTDTGRTNGTAYYYKIFTKDSNGNYSAGVVPTGSPTTPALTTLGNGTDPGAASLAPGGAATMADAFTFQTSNGTDTISAVTVTLSTGTYAGLSLVEITDSAGTTVYGSVSNPASDTPAITLTTNITTTTTLTTYKIRVTPKSHANMPAPPGASYAVTARISAWTNTKGQGGSDTAGTTVTIDNLSPGNVTAATAVSGNTQVILNWTNPVDADLDSIIVLRRTVSAVTDVPVEGSTYVVGNSIGSSTVACVVTAPTSACNDTGLTNGTVYYYKIFAKDSNGNYSATGVTPTGSPVTPAVPSDSTPPADTIDLNITATASTSITLGWTAPGNDGNTGTASSYAFRYSTSVITSGNWASATVASGPPAPQVAGTSQTFTVTGLSAATTYYFAMKTSDAIPNTSGLSNVAVGTTAAASTNAKYYWQPSNGTSIATGVTSNWGTCAAVPTGPKITTMNNIGYNCSDDSASLTGTGTFYNAYYNTAYGSNMVVTGGTATVRARDRASGGYTFTVQLLSVSASGTQTYIGSPASQAVSSGGENVYSINLSGQSTTVPSGSKLGVEIKYASGSTNDARIYCGSTANGFGNSCDFTVTETPAGDTTAPAAVTLSTGTLTDTSVVLNWTSPGDDNNTGTASTYDIRYSTAAINAGNWASATQVGGEPTPLVAGTAQSYTVTGLTANTTYYFAIKTGDKVPNWSTVSNSPSATTLDPPVGGYTADNVIPAAQISQATNGSGLITITWKGRDNQSQNVTLKTFQYSTNGGTSWSAPTNADASASLSTNWTINGGAGYTTATTLAAATAYNFTFNTKHADVTGMNNVDSSNFRIRFKLNDGGVDSVNYATSATFRVDNLKPTSTISNAVYDAATDIMTITGANFTTMATAGTDIKTYVDWSKFVWDINGDNATTPDITFVVGDITSLVITNDTTLTLQFTSTKGTAIEATSGYGNIGGADTLDVAAGFSKDFYGNAATTDAVADGPLVTTSISGTVYFSDQATNIGTGITVRLLRNGVSAGTAITDSAGTYTIWSNVTAGDAIAAYIDNDATYTGVVVSVTGSITLTGINIYAGHVITRNDNGGSLSNANMSTAKGAYVDTDILYSVTGSALTVNGTTTVLHIPVGKTYAPGGNVTTPNLVNLGTFTGGSGSITVNGDLTSGGTFTATSATTTVSGNFTNTGTYTHSSGTLLLNGTNQRVSGSSTFFNFTKSVTAADTLAFDASSTTTINGTATLNGASGQLLSLVSSTPGTRWNLNLGASATKAISYVNVADSDASGSDAAKKPILPGNSINSGNTVSWFAALSGIAYTDEGITNIGVGKTIRMVINGSNAGSAVTDASGAYSITPNSLAAGDALLVYIDNDATYTGVTATISNGNALTGLNVYAGFVITRQDNGGVLSNANMATALGAYSDTDIKYSVSAGNLTVSGAATKLYVPTGYTFAPGGNITTPTLKNLGTFTGGSGTLTVNGDLTSSGTFTATSGTTNVSGNFNNSGTFTHSSGTVNLNGTNQTITGNTTFNNLTKSVVTARTLTFAAGSTTTINGTATLNGASGQLLSLVSGTPTTRWNFILGASSTKAISYVNVTDSDASGSNAAKKPINPGNATNGGNNVSWFTPLLTFLKTVAVTSDPANSTTNPKNIPGAEELYTVRVTNSGVGNIDSNTLIITDPIPANTELFTGNLSGGAPYAFTNGTPSSALSCAFVALGNLTDCMDFSNNNGSTWSYVPNGSYDPAVTNIRFSLSGTMSADSGSGSPYFDLSFRVRIK